MTHSPTRVSDENGLSDLSKEGTLSQIERTALETIVWRKLDRRILPLCTVLYLLCTMDRTNVANARIAGLQKSLIFSNYQYNFALTLTYVSYVVAEFPSTLLLKYVGPDLVLPFAAALWGIASASQGLVTNYSGFLTCRFFLGLFEGGVPPGIVLYLSLFYPRHKLQTRVTTYLAFTSLSGAFSGLLAAAIDQLNGKGGKPGWAWIFILEGTSTVVFAMVLYLLLPRAPEKALFLTKEERSCLVCALKRAGSVSESDVQDSFSWAEVVRSLGSPHVWLLVPVWFFSGATLLGLAYFEPTIVASLGYSGNQAQLMSVPPYAVAFVPAFISAIVSDRYQCRGYTLIFFSLLQVIGFTMFYTSPSAHIRYGSLFLSVPGSLCAGPSVATWMVNNSAPHTRRATTVGVAFLMAELGGILATWLLGWISPGPDYAGATLAFIAMSTGMVVFSMANLIFLWRANRKKAERRQRMREKDEVEGLGDRSAWFIYSL